MLRTRPSGSPAMSRSTKIDRSLLTEPIPRLIRKLAVPASVGYVFNTLYNVVDTYFAGELSTEALAALSLSFPVFFLIIATGSGLSQGATVLIANALGEGDSERARRLAAQALGGALACGVLVTVVGTLAAPPLFRLLGADTPTYLGLCLEYMHTILYGAMFFLLTFTLNGILTATGDTVSFRNVLIIGCLANVGLDPLLMFGWGPIPPFGIRGLALATVMIQACAAVYLGLRLLRSRLGSGLRAAFFRPRLDLLRALSREGLPAGLNMFGVALGIFVITWFIARFSPKAVAAYGVAIRVEQLALLPTIGLNVATLTLIGQNNGAGLVGRIRETYRKAMLYGCAMMVVGGTLLLPSAPFLVRIFSDDPEVVRIGVQYLFMASFALCSYVVLFVTSSALQGLKRPMFALWVGLARQVVLPIGVFSLALWWEDLRGIWWGIFAINWSAALFALWYGRRVLPDEADAEDAAPR